jgi:RNA-directed DNA polymerase
MVLDGLEKVLRKRFPGKKINLVRYADDFIVTGPSREFLEQLVLPFIKALLAERGLQLSKEKTRLTHIREGFGFLGQNIRKYGQEGKEKLLIKLSKQAVKSVLSKAKAIFKKKVTSKTVNVVRELNPVLRGWANYHRHVCSKKVFSKVD